MKTRKTSPSCVKSIFLSQGATYMVSSTSIPERMPVPAAMPAGRLRMPIPTMPGHHESEQRDFMENLMKTPCISIPSGVVRNIVQIFSFSETIFEVGDRQCLMKIVDWKCCAGQNHNSSNSQSSKSTAQSWIVTSFAVEAAHQMQAAGDMGSSLPLADDMFHMKSGTFGDVEGDCECGDPIKLFIIAAINAGPAAWTTAAWFQAVPLCVFTGLIDSPRVTLTSPAGLGFWICSSVHSTRSWHVLTKSPTSGILRVPPFKAPPVHEGHVPFAVGYQAACHSWIRYGFFIKKNDSAIRLSH